MFSKYLADLIHVRRQNVQLLVGTGDPFDDARDVPFCDTTAFLG